MSFKGSYDGEEALSCVKGCRRNVLESQAVFVSLFRFMLKHTDQGDAAGQRPAPHAI